MSPAEAVPGVGADADTNPDATGRHAATGRHPFHGRTIASPVARDTGER